MRTAVLVLVALAVAGADARTTGRCSLARVHGSRTADKLATAFSDIDRIFADFATRTHVPGAAWGIVIDGELAHAGSSGYRDVAAKAPVDADTVFRIASMTKSFTAMSILKLRDEGKLSLDDPAERYVPELKGLTYPTTDSPRITIRHLLSHSEGFPEDNPWGDRQLADTDAQMSEMMRRRHSVLERAGHRVRVLQLRLRDPRPHRLQRVRTSVRRVRLRQHSPPARHERDDAVAVGRAGAEAGAWLPLGGRASGRTSRCSRTASFGSMGGMLTSVRDLGKYVGAFLAAWPPRDGPETLPDPPRIAARNAAGLAPVVHARRRATVERRVQLTTSGYAFGLARDADVRFPADGGAQRRAARLRIADALAARLRRRDHRVRQPHLHRLGRRRRRGVDRLAKTGGLQPRVVQPSKALVDARDAVSRLIIKWDDQLADRIAAENLFLDESKERRKAHLEGLRAKVGTCTMPDRFDAVENALRGTWTMSCASGKLAAALTLAPTMPPTVQFISVDPAPPTPPRGDTCQTMP